MQKLATCSKEHALTEVAMRCGKVQEPGTGDVLA